MTLLTRTKYAMYLFIGITMTVVLALSIAEGLGLLVEFPVRELSFHPAYVIPVAIASFLLAPVVSQYLPLPRAEQPDSSAPGRAPFGFGVRVAAIVAVGVALLIVVQALLWLLGSA